MPLRKLLGSISPRLGSIAIPALLILLTGSLALAQTSPVPDAGGPPNVFYGATPPSATNGPVIVFIHGLKGLAQDWYSNGNDMYTLAYNAGYRTAFININADGTPSEGGIENNKTILGNLLPQIATRFGVAKMILVTHSKGGVDAQAAITTVPGIASLIESVFMISPPNEGTELADWAFKPENAPISGPLGLLVDGVRDLQTGKDSPDTDPKFMKKFRLETDAVSLTQGIRYYTFAGDTYEGNPITAIAGSILRIAVPFSVNDGLVPANRTRLSILYASDVGFISTHHFKTFTGNLVFPRINALIKGSRIDEAPSLKRIDTASGFGDRQNSFAWSMGWFKGKLYVGTGRAFICVTNAIADATTGSNLYTSTAPDIECTPSPDDLPLRAEIWQYTPETKQWRRVFQSPQDVSIGNGKFTSRDMAFRGMAVHKEADGTEALYAAGVGSAGMFGNRAPYSPTNPYPAPRILRSVDGINWAPIPAAPGTFMGDITIQPPGQIIKSYGFRSLASYNGKLFATVSDFTGVGYVISSSDPKAGNNAWQRAAPIADEMPVWTLRTFNGYLYAATGSRTLGKAYAVYKTDAQGPAPYVWQEVVPPGGFQIAPLAAEAALSMVVHDNQLYVGTDRPTELIRINPNDTWELMVGTPRYGSNGVQNGIIIPTSGFTTGFGNLFNGHFWSQTSHAGSLYVGTWDWTVTLRTNPALATYVQGEYGFDLFRSLNGKDWVIESKRGFNDKFNYGVRNMVSTPIGMFLGTANPYYGLQIWSDTRSVDLSGDGVVDMSDVNILKAAVGQTAQPGDTRDLDGDGKITTNDVRKIITLCQNSGCAAATPAARPGTPGNLRSAAGLDGTVLTWDAVPGAVRYHVYVIPSTPVQTAIPGYVKVSLPGVPGSFSIQQIASGLLDSACRNAAPTDPICAFIEHIKTNQPVAAPVSLAGTTTANTLTVPFPATPAIYFIRAEDAAGKFSLASRIAGSMRP